MHAHYSGISALESITKRRHGQRGPDKKPRKIRSDAQSCINSIDHLIRDPKRNASWLATMRAAKEFAPRCMHIKRDGVKCERVAMRGSSPPRCCRHIPFDELRKIDDERYQKAEDTIKRIASPSIVERARKVQLTIEKRRLRFLWAAGGGNQAEVPGVTLFLNPGDSTAVARYLKRQSGLDIFDGSMTYRCIDSLRWAAYLTMIGRIDAVSYEKRIAVALKVEKQYWAMKGLTHDL